MRATRVASSRLAAAVQGRPDGFAEDQRARGAQLAHNTQVREDLRVAHQTRQFGHGRLSAKSGEGLARSHERYRGADAVHGGCGRQEDVHSLPREDAADLR